MKLHSTLHRAAIATGLLAGVLLGVSGIVAQDPDGGAARGQNLTAHRPAVPGIHGLVTAGHPLAAMAGLQMLMKGGNAVDATVAVGAALNLMEPQMNSVGGNGFLTVYDKKTNKVWSLSMAGAAPKALKTEGITGADLDWGVNAGIVPGNFGGYLIALQRFGTKSVAETFAPAIEYAEKGYPIDASLATAIARTKDRLAQFPTTAKIFLPNGQPPKAGEIFKNPDLAATFKKAVEAEQKALKSGKTREQAIQAAFDRFYKGDIAQEFDRFFKENKGALAAADLAVYKPEWTEPLHSTYRGYDIYSNPASSRGGFELEMALNLVEGYDLTKMGANSPEATHLLIEAIKVSKADIYRYLADPKVTKIPAEGLLSKAYAQNRRQLIQLDKAIAYPSWGEPEKFTATQALALNKPSGPLADLLKRNRQFPEEYEPEYDTTSFSIVDSTGNAVAGTPTIGGIFGAGVVVGNTGLLLNNGMRLGSTSPYPDHINYVHPGQTPLLNNSPVLVFKDGKLAFAFGTPGGETIGQTEFQMLVNLVDFHMPIQQAVENPRFALNARPNFYKPGSEITITIENRVPAATLKKLQEMGHKLNITSDYTAAVGGMQGIAIDLEKGSMVAGADPRRTGYAVGW